MPGKSATGSSRPHAATNIDRRIADLGDWRGATLSRLRDIIRKADPGIVEEWKWNVPVWSCDGIICTGETYKNAVKLTFARGAALPDPKRLFNSSLDGKVRRAIDVHEGERIDPKALTALIRAAVALNLGGTSPSKPAGRAKARTSGRASPDSTPSGRPKAAKPPKLLAGGNPQIAKGDGDAPVQAYIAAMPGWKRDVGERLDAHIMKTLPKATKAVRWNSPFYGLPGRGWLLSFHVFTRFIKVTFFDGADLTPPPPGGTPKSGNARWIDLHEGDAPDDARMTKWLKQAARLPGWKP